MSSTNCMAFTQLAAMTAPSSTFCASSGSTERRRCRADGQAERAERQQEMVEVRTGVTFRAIQGWFSWPISESLGSLGWTIDDLISMWSYCWEICEMYIVDGLCFGETLWTCSENWWLSYYLSNQESNLMNLWHVGRLGAYSKGWHHFFSVKCTDWWSGIAFSVKICIRYLLLHPLSLPTVTSCNRNLSLG